LIIQDLINQIHSLRKKCGLDKSSPYKNNGHDKSVICNSFLIFNRWV